MDGNQTRSAWTRDQVVEHIVSIPEVSAWPDFDRLLRRPVRSEIKPSWEYVCHAAEAQGGEWQAGIPGAAAVMCIHFSIHLVDDVLDEDPKGLHHRLGLGPTFNLATAFQAVAGVCLSRASVAGTSAAGAPAADKALVAMHRELHEAVLGTGYGQYLDAEEPEGEDAYWRIVRLKTPPLFHCALFLGSILGGAPEEHAEAVARLGDCLGEIAQVNDDLGDAMERPAKTDWRRKHGCLPILFARTADHPERDRFNELADRLAERLDDDDALEEAQEILQRSGAMSYCAFRLVEAYKRGLRGIEALDLPRPDRLVELFDYQILPLRNLLQRLGIGELEQLVGSA